MNSTFNGVRRFDFVWFGMPDNPNRVDAEKILRAQNRIWKVWEINPGYIPNITGYLNVRSFYFHGLPFGTVYDVDSRIMALRTLKREDPNTQYEEVMKKVRALPMEKQSDAFRDLYAPINAAEIAADVAGPNEDEKKLLQLAPDQYDLLTAHLKGDKKLPVAERFMTYNMRPIVELEYYNRNYITADEEEKVWKYHAALDPDGYFGLASLFLTEGKFAEAAEATRKGVAGGNDQVMMSNSVFDLVQYDWDHDKVDEAVEVAQKAVDTGSEGGMLAQMYVLDKQGHLEEEETLAQDEKERYGNKMSLLLVYAGHKDHFPDKYAAAEQEIFPDHLTKVDLDTFYGAPTAGVKITSDHAVLKIAGLRKDDVIVALNGYSVKSTDQYLFVRELTHDPVMDFIVWRDGKFIETKGAVPNRRIYAAISDYELP